MTLTLLISFEFSGPALESGGTVQNWIILWETWGCHRSFTEDSIHIRYPAMMSGKQLLIFWIIILPVPSGSNSIGQVIIIGYVRFEVLMAVPVFREVMPCCLVNVPWCSRVTYCTGEPGKLIYPGSGGELFPCNVRIQLLHYTASHPPSWKIGFTLLAIKTITSAKCFQAHLTAPIFL